MLIGVLGSLLMGTSVYADSYASVKVDGLNVRQSAEMEAAITGTYDKEDTVKIVGQGSDDWFAIETAKGKTAYVNKEYVDVFKVKAKVNANSVNVRSFANMDATINGQFNKGQDLSLIYQVGDWYYVTQGNKAAYSFIHKKYVDSEFLNLVPKKDIAQAKELTVKSPEPKVVKAPKAVKVNKADDIIAYGKKFVGNPYRYGGTSLTKGIDCSAFTQQVMKKAGVSLQRTSSAQYASNGKKVSTKNLQPGDLLFYGYGGRVSHVGIYIGDKKMVHAASAKTGITVSNAFRTSGKPLIGAKRVI